MNAYEKNVLSLCDVYLKNIVWRMESIKIFIEMDNSTGAFYKMEEIVDESRELQREIYKLMDEKVCEELGIKRK